jgi:drug/metabolite transporter (DMT)-like permease
VSHRAKLIIAFAAVYIIWGSTFFGVQLALKSFSPFLLSAMRLIIAGSCLVVYSVITRQTKPGFNDITKHALCGIIIFIGGMVAVAWAQQFISSSLASAIITTPFWFILLDKPQWKFYFSSKWIISGLLLSLIGVIILMSFKQGRVVSTDDTMKSIAIFIMVLGSGLWAGGSLYLISSTNLRIFQCT